MSDKLEIPVLPEPTTFDSHSSKESTLRRDSFLSHYLAAPFRHQLQKACCIHSHTLLVLNFFDLNLESNLEVHAQFWLLRLPACNELLNEFWNKIKKGFIEFISRRVKKSDKKRTPGITNFEGILNQIKEIGMAAMFVNRRGSRSWATPEELPVSSGVPIPPNKKMVKCDASVHCSRGHSRHYLSVSAWCFKKCSHGWFMARFVLPLAAFPCTDRWSWWFEFPGIRRRSDFGIGEMWGVVGERRRRDVF